jgi:hypothetical protein
MNDLVESTRTSCKFCTCCDSHFCCCLLTSISSVLGLTSSMKHALSDYINKVNEGECSGVECSIYFAHWNLLQYNFYTAVHGILAFLLWTSDCHQNSFGAHSTCLWTDSYPFQANLCQFWIPSCVLLDFGTANLIWPAFMPCMQPVELLGLQECFEGYFIY